VSNNFYFAISRLKIPGDGLAVSTFHMTKDTGGVNRNAFWSKETRIAKFCMKTLFSPVSASPFAFTVMLPATFVGN
jgi:hypothetical protein